MTKSLVEGRMKSVEERYRDVVGVALDPDDGLRFVGGEGVVREITA